jgi:hypothetical protein
VFRCPKCNYAIESESQIFPNFLLNELVTNYKASLENKLRTSGDQPAHPDLKEIRSFLSK